MYFFEKVPNPRISTLLSRAIASKISSKINAVDVLISFIDKLGCRFNNAFSISERVKVLLEFLFTKF